MSEVNDEILDRPIKVDSKDQLPQPGVRNQVYRCNDTKTYYRFNGETYIEMDTHRRVTWIPLEDILEVVKKARTMEWLWFRGRNIDRKYINVRIDMRDGRCIITDNKGHPVTLAELQEQ